MIYRRWIGLGALALAACGSDDGGSGGTTSTPTPTATTSPTPTPTPTSTPSATPTATPTTASMATFAELTASTRLEAASSRLITDGNPPGVQAATAFGSSIPYQYDPSARSIATIDSGTSQTWVASEIDATAPAGTIRWIGSANKAPLTLIQPAPGGTGARWLRFIEHTRLQTQRVIGITGIPTPVAQIPASGTVSYAKTALVGDAYIATGSQVATYSLTPSTITATIDYTAKRVNFTLAIIGRPTAGGADVAIVTVTGTTDFAGGTPMISSVTGTFTQTPMFTIAAALFGPAGAEAGAVYDYQAMNAAGTQNVRLVGRIALAQ